MENHGLGLGLGGFGLGLGLDLCGLNYNTDINSRFFSYIENKVKKIVNFCLFLKRLSYLKKT